MRHYVRAAPQAVLELAYLPLDQVEDPSAQPARMGAWRMDRLSARPSSLTSQPLAFLSGVPTARQRLAIAAARIEMTGVSAHRIAYDAAWNIER